MLFNVIVSEMSNFLLYDGGLMAILVNLPDTCPFLYLVFIKAQLDNKRYVLAKFWRQKSLAWNSLAFLLLYSEYSYSLIIRIQLRSSFVSNEFFRI